MILKVIIKMITILQKYEIILIYLCTLKTIGVYI